MPRLHPTNLAGDAACGLLARADPARDSDNPPWPDMQTAECLKSTPRELLPPPTNWRNFMGRGLVAAVVLLWLTTAAPALSFQFMLSLRRALGVLPLAQRESIGGFRQHFRILCCVHTH